MSFSLEDALNEFDVFKTRVVKALEEYNIPISESVLGAILCAKTYTNLQTAILSTITHVTHAVDRRKYIGVTDLVTRLNELKGEAGNHRRNLEAQVLEKGRLSVASSC